MASGSRAQLKTLEEAQQQILFGLIGVWATSFILHAIFNAKWFDPPALADKTDDSISEFTELLPQIMLWILGIIDFIAVAGCMVPVFEGMGRIVQYMDWLTSYLCAIASPFALGWISVIKNGRVSFSGWIEGLGWPNVAIVTIMGLGTVVASVMDEQSDCEAQQMEECMVNKQDPHKSTAKNKRKGMGKNKEDDREEEDVDVDLESGEALIETNVEEEADIASEDLC